MERFHQNVSGDSLSLKISHQGNSKLCRGYSIEKCGQGRVGLWLGLGLGLLGLGLGLMGLGSAAGAAGTAGSGITAALLLYSFVWEVKKEDLLVIPPVGIQFTATFRMGQQITCFIPWQHIKDVLIIEAISMQRVLYNLVVYTESCQSDPGGQRRRIFPLFQGTKPRLACLEPIYQSIQDLLSNVQ